MKLLSNQVAYENYYHFVGATKYRKNLFYDDSVRVRLKNIILEIVEKKDEIELVECAHAKQRAIFIIGDMISSSETMIQKSGKAGQFWRNT